MFYEKEIRYREQANYPPFVELVNILIKDKNEEKAKKKAYNLYKSLKEEKGISIIGPAPCRLYRIENFYRWQIMIKAVDKSKLSDFLKEYKSILLKDKGVIVDINPVEML
jgi:primosomal protein N' (replication factor Y)